MSTTTKFDENTLREEIHKVWGAHGAHAQVYEMLIKRARLNERAILDLQEQRHAQRGSK